MVTLTKAMTYREALGGVIEGIQENHRIIDACFRGDITGRNERWIQCVYVILGKAENGSVVIRKAIYQLTMMPANADPRGDAERCMAELESKNADTLADGSIMRYTESAYYEVGERGANILAIHEYKE